MSPTSLATAALESSATAPRSRFTSPGVQVNSKLMQNYRLASPVTVNGTIVVAQDRHQRPTLFSIGSDKTVYCFREYANSDTGWSQISLQLQASAISVGRTADGNLILLTTSQDNIVYREENADGTWGQPQMLPFPAPGGIGPLSHVEVRNAEGQLYLIAFYSLSGTRGEAPYGPLATIWEGGNTSPDNTVTLTHVDGFGVAVGNVAPGQFGYLEFLTPQVFTKMATQYSPDNFVYQNLGIWRPLPPSGYTEVGDYALNGSANPNGSQILTARGLSDPLSQPVVARADGYSFAWNNKNKGNTQVSLWEPYVSGGGYSSLGFVANSGYDAPAPGVCLMIRNDLVAEGNNYVNAPGKICDTDSAEYCNLNSIYINENTPLGVDRITADSASTVNSYTFYAHPGTDYPPGSSVCLKAETRQYTTALFVTDDPLHPHRLDRADTLLSQYSVTNTAQNVLAVFGLTAAQQLVYLDPTQNGAWTPITDDISQKSLTFRALSACQNAAGLLEVYLIGTDHFLYVVRQNENNTPGWEPIVPLRRDVQFVTILTTQDQSGNACLFAVSVDGRLHQMFQDPATSTWVQNEIELQKSGALEEIRTYSTEIAIIDDNGVMQPNMLALIWAEDETLALLNGQAFLLDPQNKQMCVSNAGGKVTVVIETTSLYSPALKISTPFLPDGSSVMIQPNAIIQDDLENNTASGQQLLDAKLQVKDKNGNYSPLILPPYNNQSDADAVAAATHNLMGLLPSTLNPESRTCPYLARNHDLRGLHFIPQDDGTFTLPAAARRGRSMPNPHWQLDFRSGRPVFRSLTAEEAAGAMKELQGLPSPLGFFDWLDDLGDLVEEVVNEIVEIATVTATTIGDTIQAAVTFVVDGVNYLYNLTFDLIETTIEMIEQAFDVVACIFAKIAVAFEQLFEWLGALFDWDDILRTHQVIAYTLGQSLDFATQALASVQAQVNAGLDNFFQQVDAGFDEVINNILGGPNQTLAGIQQSDVHPSPDTQNALSNNIVYSGLMDNIPKSAQKTHKLAIARREYLKDSAGDPIQALIDAVNDQGEKFQSSQQAFKDAETYLTGMFDNTDTILQSALGALFSLLKGIAEAGLAVAQTLINLVFDAVQAIIHGVTALLNEEWDIPFLSELYSFITDGSSLTALDLFSLVIAVPTTILYKLTHGNTAPYPDDQSVADFKAGFTTAWILQQSGLGTNGALTSAALEGWRDGLADFFGTVSGCCYGVYGLVEVILDFWPPLDATQPPALISQSALALEWLIYVFSLPWASSSSNTSGMSCHGADAFGNLSWLLSGIGPALDTAMYIETSQKNPSRIGVILRNYGNSGVAIDCAWAIFSFAMVCTYAIKKNGANKLGVAEAFMGAIPGIFKFCRIQKLVVKSKGISLAILAVLDGIGDESVAIMQLVGSSSARAIPALPAAVEPAERA